MAVIKKVSPKGANISIPEVGDKESVKNTTVDTEAGKNIKEAPVVERRGSALRSDTSEQIRTKKVCYFCRGKTAPRYWDAAALRKFMNDRGRIAPRMRAGTCAKHQRSVSREIKRARHLALLPFTVRV